MEPSYEQPEIVDEEQITRRDLESIDFGVVICGERSVPGAMGLNGHVWLYVLEGNRLVRYQTWLESDERLYCLAWDLVERSKDWFEFTDGGFGNEVFVRKGAFLVPSKVVTEEVSDLFDEGYGDCYWVYNGQYRIAPSNLGVYRYAAREWKMNAHMPA
jgi:hypothetical protein